MEPHGRHGGQLVDPSRTPGHTDGPHFTANSRNLPCYSIILIGALCCTIVVIFLPQWADLETSAYKATGNTTDDDPNIAITTVTPSALPTANPSSQPSFNPSLQPTKDESCFHPRSNDHLIGHALPKPLLNVGFPKMGTSSLHAFFECGHINTSQWLCPEGKYKIKKTPLCADCMKKAVSLGHASSLLRDCGNYEAYTQLDGDSFYPQAEYFENFHDESPNATFVLPFRDVPSWYRSLKHWGNARTNLAYKAMIANIRGFPPMKPKFLPDRRVYDEEEFSAISTWWCNHVQFVREFVKEHPSHALVEYDMMDPDVGEKLEKVFNISSTCWGHKNQNPELTKGNDTSDKSEYQNLT